MINWIRRLFGIRYGVTQIRMSGIMFYVPVHYLDMKQQIARGIKTNRFLEIPGQGRRVIINARQVIYIAEADTLRARRDRDRAPEPRRTADAVAEARR